MADRDHSDGKGNAAEGQHHDHRQGTGDGSARPSEPAEDRKKTQGLGALQVVGSVFAAALGVQSSRNRERDFRQGRPGTFIAAGVIATVLFIGAVVTVVKLVLAGAG